VWDGNAAANQKTKYQITVGDFIMQGPINKNSQNAQNYGCELTMICDFEIPGVGLLQSNSVLIIRHGGSNNKCGAADAVIADIESVANPAQALASTTDTVSKYNIGRPSSGEVV
jgi:hypothetical protein